LIENAQAQSLGAPLQFPGSDPKRPFMILEYKFVDFDGWLAVIAAVSVGARHARDFRAHGALPQWIGERPLLPCTCRFLGT